MQCLCFLEDLANNFTTPINIQKDVITDTTLGPYIDILKSNIRRNEDFFEKRLIVKQNSIDTYGKALYRAFQERADKTATYSQWYAKVNAVPAIDESKKKRTHREMMNSAITQELETKNRSKFLKYDLFDYQKKLEILCHEKTAPKVRAIFVYDSTSGSTGKTNFAQYFGNKYPNQSIILRDDRPETIEAQLLDCDRSSLKTIFFDLNQTSALRFDIGLIENMMDGTILVPTSGNNISLPDDLIIVVFSRILIDLTNINEQKWLFRKVVKRHSLHDFSWVDLSMRAVINKFKKC